MDILVAITMILEVEGKTWSIGKNDRGKETYCGISRKYHHHLKMWPIIDIYKEKYNGNINPQLLSFDLLKDNRIQAFVYDFYSSMYCRLRIHEINNGVLARMFFQAAVNKGEKDAIIWLQRSIVSCGKKIKVDGKIGDETIKACNEIESTRATHYIGNQHEAYWIEKCSRDFTQVDFMRGITNRINHFRPKESL